MSFQVPPHKTPMFMSIQVFEVNHNPTGQDSQGAGESPAPLAPAWVYLRIFGAVVYSV